MALDLWETLLTSILSGAIAGFGAYKVQERKLEKEYQLQDSTARFARELMSDTKWPLRSFKVIRHHLGGFDDNALRQILVRAGAIRFKSKGGEELWGLIDRNRHRLGVTQIDSDPANLRDESLFS